MGLASLFIDLNAYFASVEQHLRPRLRGRPVAVVPMMIGSTCCIAASYEAKRFGVKTGTLVAEAKRLCPALVLVKARPVVYTEHHHKIIEVIETCIPVSGVHSIDEVSCLLARDEREPRRAMELALDVKRAIREKVGECLRCSIGLAPNRFLAKVGTDMQKPDGLVVIEEKDLPGKLLALELIDLPGIGPRMRRRLSGHGIETVEQLCALSEKQMERIWESVVGRRWWHWLRGHELFEAPTRRRSIGHSHVLPPALRNDEAARGVAVRLLHKAAARARDLAYAPERMSLSVEVRRRGQGTTWGACAALNGCRDTLTLVDALARMWADRPPGQPVYVDITLHDLVGEGSATLPLFPEERHRAQLAQAIDRLNSKYGRHTVYAASMHGSKDHAPGGIAFSSIPDLDLPDAVG